MADSDITVSGLTAEGGVNQILLTWNTPNDPNNNGLPYLQKEAVEIWGGTANNRNAVTTTKLGEQPDSNAFAHTGLSRGATYYYWIKARNKKGMHGEWYPVSPTGGVGGTESNSDVLLQTNGYKRDASGFIEQWGYYVQVGLGGGGVAVDFPRPFPNRCFNVTASATSSAIQFGLTTHPEDDVGPNQVWGTTGFSVLAQQGARISWRAIGY